MSEYRNKKTGEVLSQGQVRAANSNTSLPRVWTSDTLEFLNVDPILGGAQPTPSTYQRVERQGVEQIGDNWHEKWTCVDMFADTTVDGKTTTKAQHEAAYQVTLDAALALSERAKRDALLAETDYYALTDVTMNAAMTTYRQQLREVPQQSEFPSTISWPTKP